MVTGSIFLANGLILAWTPPSASPPSSNISGSLNVGSTGQYKSGALGVGGVLRGYSDIKFDDYDGCSALETDADGDLVCGTDDVGFSSESDDLQTVTNRGASTNKSVIINNNLTVSSQVIGGFGAQTTSGTLDWNDSSNARSGNGYTLLLGSASNGPGPAVYYHPFSFEYSSKGGTGNMTQLAVPYYTDYGGYGSNLFIRSKYYGTWSSWKKILAEDVNGNVGIGTLGSGYKLTVDGSIGTPNTNHPYLVLDSSSSGDNYDEQSAQISLGESGRGGAALHLAYTGNGYSYIGMGDLGSDNIPDNWVMQMYYTLRAVQFASDIFVGNQVRAQSYNICYCIQCQNNNGAWATERCASFGNYTSVSQITGTSGDDFGGCRIKLYRCP